MALLWYNKSMKKSVLYVVIPCYNEEGCLAETTKRLTAKLEKLEKDGKISDKSTVVYVDDGSKDKTWELIEKFAKENKHVVGLKLAHNAGHQNALLAGLMYAKDCCDISVSMDADLQDDINVIDKFLEAYAEGNEIVYGVRSERKKDSAFKRGTAQGFYRVMQALGVDVVYNSADCRLMSKKALEQLAEYKEVNLFLRGLVPLIGLKTTTAEYARDERFAGESKYPLKKMLNFAWDGITSFSIKPIRLVLWVGVIMAAISLLVMLYALIMWMTGNVVSGWTFTICSIWFVAGVQMVSLGMIGEYVGKIYAETKARPRYFVERTTKD